MWLQHVNLIVRPEYFQLVHVVVLVQDLKCKNWKWEMLEKELMVLAFIMKPTKKPLQQAAAAFHYHQQNSRFIHLSVQQRESLHWHVQ